MVVRNDLDEGRLMADLDMTDALTEPAFTSSFDVVRRAEVVNAFGESTVPEPLRICGVVGVICMASNEQLVRLDDQQRMGRNISVVTQFRLRGPAIGKGGQNFQPDLIKWQGDHYVVSYLDPYTNFGSGFVEAVASSIDFIDKAPA